jgi:hypothetical protein
VTLASITFQNYFRLYKSSRHDRYGDDRSPEFMDIYSLDVIEIPTNKPVNARGFRRRGLSHGGREIPRHRHPDCRMPHEGPAGSRGHVSIENPKT